MSTERKELPVPGSEEQVSLFKLHGFGQDKTVIYQHMYEHRSTGLTYPELQTLTRPELGELSQLQRRKRDLHKLFNFERVTDGSSIRHRLIGRRQDGGAIPDQGISGKLRISVLEKGFCFSCGKSPQEDRVKLVVDHVFPQHWGGSNERWNLQPLCEQCNGEKKDRLSDFDSHSKRLAAAVGWPEPQKRIGELLLAFDGDWVPGFLVEVAAMGGEPRKDPTRRIRDLRKLGWEYETRKRYDQGKYTSTDYRLVRSAPWPSQINKVLGQARAADQP